MIMVTPLREVRPLLDALPRECVDHSERGVGSDWRIEDGEADAGGAVGRQALLAACRGSEQAEGVQQAIAQCGRSGAVLHLVGLARGRQAALLRVLAHSLIAGLVSGLVFGLVGRPVAGLLFGLSIGLESSLFETDWPSYMLTRGG
jgi:hypothetical protein